jgi:acetyl esterase/lipase
MTDAQIGAIRALLTSRPRPTDLAERRERVDWLGQQDPLPADVHAEPVEANGVAAEWTWTPAADASRVVLFLHGGGYVSGSIASHRATVSQLGREAGARTLALGYRLAPEHPFPAALEDALAGYRFLLAQGFAPERIAIGGESAGGGLAIASLVALRDAGDPPPSCAWCASPWVDLTMSGATMAGKDAEDPLIHKPYLQDLARQYLAGADARDPRASPLLADLRGLPPVLIQVGSAETLLDDAVRLAGAAGAAGVPVTLRVWPDMIHAWHLYWQRLGAGHRSLAEAGAFIRGMLR